jgi:hypothetical protein
MAARGITAAAGFRAYAFFSVSVRNENDYIIALAACA